MWPQANPECMVETLHGNREGKRTRVQARRTPEANAGSGRQRSADAREENRGKRMGRRPLRRGGRTRPLKSRHRQRRHRKTRQGYLPPARARPGSNSADGAGGGRQAAPTPLEAGTDNAVQAKQTPGPEQRQGQRGAPRSDEGVSSPRTQQP